MSEARKHSGKILVVDDDPIVRLISGAALKQAGFDLVEAADGLEALEAYRRQPREIAAVLLDLMMPRMDGYEAFRELRRLAPRLPVLIVTSVPTARLVPFHGKELVSYLKKPIRPEVLIHQVVELLAAARIGR